MGQALRRAACRARSPGTERPPENPSRVVPSESRFSKTDVVDGADPDISRLKNANVLEEREPEYDAILSKMVGRITVRPGGKLEMGEAFVVQRYNRPLPKVRTNATADHDEQKPTAPGTLNTTTLRHILLLHQGKADDHDGPMEVHLIAEKFKIDATQVERILQFISLPPEDNDKKTAHDNRPQKTGS